MSTENDIKHTRDVLRQYRAKIFPYAPEEQIPTGYRSIVIRFKSASSWSSPIAVHMYVDQWICEFRDHVKYTLKAACLQEPFLVSAMIVLDKRVTDHPMFRDL